MSASANRDIRLLVWSFVILTAMFFGTKLASADRTVTAREPVVLSDDLQNSSHTVVNADGSRSSGGGSHSAGDHSAAGGASGSKSKASGKSGKGGGEDKSKGKSSKKTNGSDD